MYTNTSPKGNAKKRWPMQCIHDKDICSICNERIIKRISLDLESRMKIKSANALKRPVNGSHLVYNQKKVGSFEEDNALKELLRRKEKANGRSLSKDFYNIRPDSESDTKSPIQVDKILDRLFSQDSVRNCDAENALNALLEREKQMNLTTRAKDFFIIHPDWVSEKKNPLRVAKTLEHLCNQGRVNSYEATGMLSAMMRREKQMNEKTRAKEFFIIHPDWVSEKKSPLRVKEQLRILSL